MSDVQDARYRSWTRRLARRAMGRYVGTRLRPNHVTAVRIVTGIAACLLFATGDNAAVAMGGVLWVVSTFLDRCDGEFARMGGTSSRIGHAFDLTGDIALNALVFLALAEGAVNAGGPAWLYTLGVFAAAGIALAGLLAELNERGMPAGVKTFNGAFGFDFDDLIYLIALFPWFDLLPVLLIGAAVGGPLAALVIAVRFVARRRKQHA
jgi:archaetidylinositol phosphate synthase